MIINTAIILFIIAALFGAIILTAILQNKPTPKHFVLLHGPIAAIALVLLIVDIVKGHAEGLLVASLVIFILAALGGFTLFSLDMLKKPIPKPLALLHPAIAVIGLIVLVVYAFR